jgi:hypothetical protein
MHSIYYYIYKSTINKVNNTENRRLRVENKEVVPHNNCVDMSITFLVSDGVITDPVEGRRYDSALGFSIQNRFSYKYWENVVTFLGTDVLEYILTFPQRSHWNAHLYEATKRELANRIDRIFLDEEKRSNENI